MVFLWYMMITNARKETLQRKILSLKTMVLSILRTLEGLTDFRGKCGELDILFSEFN